MKRVTKKEMAYTTERGKLADVVVSHIGEGGECVKGQGSWQRITVNTKQATNT